tara:strand:- start:535 stop:1350 length:816 start_codon:yes stop_codon:yes gene_type:complete
MAVEPTAEDNSYSEFVDALESTGGKAFAEFMACEAGADFNAENATKMISDWQKLITAESLFGVWGYVPAADTNAFGDTLWWELNWNSKEEADAEWNAWVQNEDAQAWAEQYSNVMVCDGEGRNSFDGVYPILPNTYGDVNESGYFYAEFHQCNYIDGSDRTDAEAFLPGFTNAVSNSDYNGTGYSFANYFAYKNEDGSHVDADVDFLWGSFTKGKDAMDKATESFENDVREEMFPLFSEFATCGEVPDVYHGWTFYVGDNKEFMPDFTSRD